jgi:hypothetical protein
MAKKSHRRSSRKSHRRSHRKNRSTSRRMYGGACALGGAPYGVDTMQPASAMSIGQGEQFAAITRPYHGGGRTRRRMRGGMAPLSIFGNDTAGVARDMAHMRGQDMALNQAAAYSASPAGQDNPNIPTVIDKQAGGRRRRRGRKSNRKSHRKNRRSHRRTMRGGMALLTGAPWSQTGSDRLLADSPALAAEAVRLESPTWKGVEEGTYLG